jgi:hypothetical protein
LLGKLNEMLFFKTGEVLTDLSIRNWMLSKMYNQASISEALLNQQVLKEGLNCLNGEVEILVLRISQNIVQEACESDDQLTHETSNHIDTVLFGLGVTDIVYFGGARYKLILSGSPDSSGSYFFKKKSNSMTLPCSRTLLLP